MDRNLLNYPLARDPRLGVKWRRIKGTDDVRCRLEGNRLSYRLPARFNDRRIPNGIDTAVLFWLLAEARITGSPKISIKSLSDLLGGIGLSDHTNSRRKVRAALALWSSIAVRFERWHDAGEKDARKRLLPPPIKKLDLAARELIMNEEWNELGDRYFQAVSQPLPTRASVQNLILLILTSREWHPGVTDPDNWTFTHWRTLRGLCGAIGLHHKERNVVLKRAIEAAREWFELHHGYALLTKVEGRAISFLLYKPDARPEEPQEGLKPEPKIERKRKRVEAQVRGRTAIKATDDTGCRVDCWLYPDGRVEDMTNKERVALRN